jgi:hypothetical protein
MAIKSTCIALFLWTHSAFVFGQIGGRTVDSTLLPLARSITLNAASDSDKVVAICQWVCKNIEYDYHNSGDERPSDSFQSPAVVISRKKAVCDGYAQVFRDLCLLNNIYAGYIVGYTCYSKLTDSAQVLHAWNSVRVNNTWYLMDLTWEDVAIEFNKISKKENKLSPHERILKQINKRRTKRLGDDSPPTEKDAGQLGIANIGSAIDSTTAPHKPVSYPTPDNNVASLFPTPSASYLFVQPKTFRTDHLPKDPLWQLTDSVVSLQKFFFQNDPSVSPYFSTHFDYKKRLEELPNLTLVEQQHRELSRQFQYNSRDWLLIQTIAFDYSNRVHQTFEEFSANASTAPILELEQLLIKAELDLVQSEGFHRLAGTISTGYAAQNMIKNLATCESYRQHIEQSRAWLRTYRKD